MSIKFNQYASTSDFTVRQIYKLFDTINFEKVECLDFSNCQEVNNEIIQLMIKCKSMKNLKILKFNSCLQIQPEDLIQIFNNSKKVFPNLQ